MEMEICGISVLQYRAGLFVAQYDLHIDRVVARDAGVYTCVDEAGMGMKGSARLTVQLHDTTQTSSTTRISATSRSTSTSGRSVSLTHATGTPFTY